MTGIEKKKGGKWGRVKKIEDESIKGSIWREKFSGILRLRRPDESHKGELMSQNT